MRCLLVFGLFILLCACTPSEKNYYTPTIHSWRGAHFSSLLKTWGEPDKKIINSNKSRIYVYYTESPYHYPVPSIPQVGLNVNAKGVPIITNPNTNMTWNRGNTSSLTCLAIFEIAPNGMIINTQIQGDYCYMNEKNAKKMSR